MVKITAPIADEWIAAVERAARMLKAGHQATSVGDRVYQVRSASHPDTIHTVRIRNLGQLDATCDCPTAGTREQRASAGTRRRHSARRPAASPGRRLAGRRSSGAWPASPEARGSHPPGVQGSRGTGSPPAGHRQPTGHPPQGWA